MKSFFWSLIFLFCSMSIFFIGKGVDNIDIMSERYKRALDAGANAASSYRAYATNHMVGSLGAGYGTGLEDRSNVPVEREAALKWFYRLFFRNLSIYDEDIQARLKSCIPMKAIICYDRLMIADVDDNWHTYDSDGAKEYVLQYGGRSYKFTLSEQLYDMEAEAWVKAADIGLEEKERKAILTKYIADELNSFLRNRENRESGLDYELVFALEDAAEEKLSGISGVNFLVFCEGLPIPSLNPFKPEYFYAYSIGGGEIVRHDADTH